MQDIFGEDTLLGLSFTNCYCCGGGGKAFHFTEQITKSVKKLRNSTNQLLDEWKCFSELDNDRNYKYDTLIVEGTLLVLPLLLLPRVSQFTERYLHPRVHIRLPSFHLNEFQWNFQFPPTTNFSARHWRGCQINIHMLPIPDRHEDGLTCLFKLAES